MPSKRARQIQRTTSMSQLGGDAGCFTMGARFSRTAPESFHKEALASFPEDAASFHRELSPPARQELLDDMQICTGAANADGLILEGTLNNMPIDGSIEESLSASHACQPDALYPSHQASPLGKCPAYLGAHQAANLARFNVPVHGKSVAFFQGHDELGSEQPVHFLDVCFLCAKRLGHGRDVFIYRGDRAFCSEECRHSQIMADEREKHGRKVSKGRVGANSPASDPPTCTGQVETAAAA